LANPFTSNKTQLFNPNVLGAPVGAKCNQVLALVCLH